MTKHLCSLYRHIYVYLYNAVDICILKYFTILQYYATLYLDVWYSHNYDSNKIIVWQLSFRRYFWVQMYINLVATFFWIWLLPILSMLAKRKPYVYCITLVFTIYSGLYILLRTSSKRFSHDSASSANPSPELIEIGKLFY